MTELERLPESDYLDKSGTPPLARPPAAAFDLLPDSMPTDPLVHVPRADLAARPTLAAAGQAADVAAAGAAFDSYRRRQSAQTLRRQDASLDRFAVFLAAAGVAGVGDLANTPAAWAGVTWGLVEAFVAWLLGAGYAIGTVNIRLSDVKTYAQLAAKAGVLAPEAYALIKAVAGYRHSAGVRVDEKRAKTRTGSKKGEPTSISRSQARKLKAQPTPRDALILALLLDHGLRVGEVAALEARHFDRDAGLLTFYRSKVTMTQTHRLSADAQAAAEELLPALPAGGRLFPGTRQINRLVRAAGQACGLAGLSPHDCRHYWATMALRAGSNHKAVQSAGGWKSPAMVFRYAEAQEVANDGVRLD